MEEVQDMKPTEQELELVYSEEEFTAEAIQYPSTQCTADLHRYRERAVTRLRERAVTAFTQRTVEAIKERREAVLSIDVFGKGLAAL